MKFYPEHFLRVKTLVGDKWAKEALDKMNRVEVKEIHTHEHVVGEYPKGCDACKVLRETETETK